MPLASAALKFRQNNATSAGQTLGRDTSPLKVRRVHPDLKCLSSSVVPPLHELVNRAEAPVNMAALRKVARASNLKLIFIPYFDCEVGPAQHVFTSFRPQIGPQLQTRMCTEQEKNAAHWFQAPEMCIVHM